MPIEQKTIKVAIIGAGFGGISVARVLAGEKGVEVTIIDRRNHHLFQPLLYQVAMAGLNPSEISIPIRRLFRRSDNVNVVLAEVEKIDVDEKRVCYDSRWESFDHIVIACGAKHFYFGNDQWESFAPGLKNIEQATEIRRRILTAFEMAEKEKDPERQKAYLSFCVVGAGPTGVELAGAISEMTKNTLMDDFKLADLRQTKVYLLEAGPRVLAAFPDDLSSRAEADLVELGVTVLKNTMASDLSEDGLRAGDTWLDCKTIIWAAGVKPARLADATKAEKDKAGRFVVQGDLTLHSNPRVFAIGDVASFLGKSRTPLPGIAPVAIQQGQFVGQQILRDARGQQREQFRYWDKGIMATVGRSRAVVSSGKLKLTGFLAWLAWVFIHVVYLMRFRNKVFVFLQWVWGYFSFGHGARLIVNKSWRFYDGEKLRYHAQKSEGSDG